MRISDWSSDVCSSDLKANLDKVAQQFEAVFVNLMLKEARKTSLGGGLFDSNSLKTFRDMQDNQVAAEMGRRGTLGIAKAMAAFIERSQVEQPKCATFSASAHRASAPIRPRSTTP